MSSRVLTLAALAFAALVRPGRAAAQDASRAPLSAADSAIASSDLRWWSALEAGDVAQGVQAFGGGAVDVDVSGIRRSGTASITSFVSNCKTADVVLSGMRVTRFAATAVVSYRVALKQSCWGQAAPSALNVLTVYERAGDAWTPVAHAEAPAAAWRK